MSLSSKSSPLSGIVPPLVTPLNDQEEIDRAALVRLIEHLVSGGVHGLFILGTTGEGPSLGHGVRSDLIESACEATKGRIPVLVGVTDTSLAEAIEMSSAAADAGADAVVFAPPSYFPIEQSELISAVRRLAAESPLPVMLYNMPALTKTWFEAATVERLLDEPKLVGVKDSSGDLAYFKSLRSIVSQRPDWSLMAGPEHLLAETIAIGGDGGVCAGANLFPGLFVALYNAAKSGTAKDVETLHASVERLGELYTLGSNPALTVVQGVKAALELQGICSGRLCYPFTALDSGQTESVRRIIDEVTTALEPLRPLQVPSC